MRKILLIFNQMAAEYSGRHVLFDLDAKAKTFTFKDFYREITVNYLQIAGNKLTRFDANYKVCPK